jgi:hypothetical protein
MNDKCGGTQDTQADYEHSAACANSNDPARIRVTLLAAMSRAT